MFHFLSFSSGISSWKALRTHSIMENWEPNPRVANMRKKKTDQRGAIGILAKASG